MSLTETCESLTQDLRVLGLPELVAVTEAAATLAKTNPDLDGCFALDLVAAFPDEAATVRRVIDLLKQRGKSAPSPVPGITVKEAVAEFQSGAWLRLGKGTRDGYGRAYRRLIDAYGDLPFASVRTGDLAGLVARLTAREETHGAFHGKGAARQMISAYRTLWTFCDEQGYGDERVAGRVKKPTLPPTKRRALEHSEMKVVRQVARTARDPKKDTAVIVCCEALLMRKMEAINVPINAYKRDRRVIGVYGKRNKWREIPVPPRAAEFLDEFIEDRRPEDIPSDEWWNSSEKLLRYRPTPAFPHGRPLGDSGWDSILMRCQKYAPSIFGPDVVLHSYRHSGGRWLERNRGVAVAKGALGHSAENPTEAYTKADLSEIREGLTAYEEWVHGSDGLWVPAHALPKPYEPPTTYEVIPERAA